MHEWFFMLHLIVLPLCLMAKLDQTHEVFYFKCMACKSVFISHSNSQHNYCAEGIVSPKGTVQIYL